MKLDKSKPTRIDLFMTVLKRSRHASEMLLSSPGGLPPISRKQQAARRSLDSIAYGDAVTL